ncbi:MAG: hypothetical protein JWR16_1168 [Nevskia sp.]|nr:hypothetical protein [Nevskia sp.]
MDFLFDASETLTYCVTLLLLVLAAELGFRLGRRESRGIGEHTRSQAGAIQAAVLGLLALLLGFTFSLSSARFDARKQLVVQEANAIGTAALRAALLPQPYPRELAKLFPPYVQVRLGFLDAGTDQDQLKEVARRTQALQTQMWALATAAAIADPHAVSTGLALQALNDMFDVTSKRSAALRNRVPESVLQLLFFVAFVSFALTGYSLGLSGARALKLVLMLAALVAAVIILIVDLDRPRRGLIVVSQQSMLDLQQSLGAPD